MINIKKKCEEYTEKNLRLERIKSNNLKVNKKVKLFRYIRLKFQDLREYFPNYNIIEKHKPEVKLNTKSKRIFPSQFIKRYIYTFDNNDNKTNEIKMKKKFIKNDSDLLGCKKNTLIHKILNKNYKRNNQDDFIGEKNHFFISSVDIRNNNKNRINSVFIRSKNRNRSII